MCLYTRITPKLTETVGYASTTVDLSFIDPDNGSVTLLGPMRSYAKNQYFTTRAGYKGFEFLPSPWPDQACVANLSFRLFYRKCKLIFFVLVIFWFVLMLRSFVFECLSGKTREQLKWRMENLLGKMAPNEFFKSETFSDVVVECEGQTFPAHRIILAGTVN